MSGRLAIDEGVIGVRAFILEKLTADYGRGDAWKSMSSADFDRDPIRDRNDGHHFDLAGVSL